MEIFKLILLVQVRTGKLVFCGLKQDTYWVIPNYKIAAFLIALQLLMYFGFALAFFVGKMLRENSAAVAIMLIDAGMFYSFFWGVNKWASSREWTKLPTDIATGKSVVHPQ